MVLMDTLSRLVQAFEENPNSGHEIEEIQELLFDAPDDDIQGLSKQFTAFCHSLTDALIKSRASVRGIKLLERAITKFGKHRFQLTPIHSDLCLLCLDSKCLYPALQYLDIDYIEIRKTDDKEEDVKHVLLYYYYGGLVYAAVKNFERASYFFEVVLTMPANVMSPIMQETYKKQIIMALLLNGKVPDNLLPKYTSPCVTRQKKQVGFHYLKLAQEYSSLNHEKIRRLVNSFSNVYERDENMGLIKQCMTQVHKRNIQRLTKTFLTLPLRDVASHVGLATEKDAEMYIINMIDDGEIFATINQKDGMVVFQDNPERFDTAIVFQKLQEDMSVSMMLIKTLKSLDATMPVEQPKFFDTSSSMNQRTYLGARPTLLDVAKDAVEKFLKARARDIASRGDRYMLLTFEDPPLNIKAGWKESHAVFMNELKHLTATGITNMGTALKNAFDLLNLNRMQSGIDMYGLGRVPYYLEPSMIIVITDGSSLTYQGGVQQTLELPMQNHIVPGSELTREPFRWDQRLFSLVLRLTGTPPTDSGTNSSLTLDHSPIGAMCAVTAGRSYLITSQRSIIQSIEALVQKVQSGVVIQFEKIGPDPPPAEPDPTTAATATASNNNNISNNDNNSRTTSQTLTLPQSTVSLIYVHRALQKNFPVGHWPIPEAYWPDPNLASLPPRTAHPIVKFTCAQTEPHMLDTLPFDKYELESSPLTQYILSRKQPHVAWQVFVSNSGKQPGEIGAPFGYLKAATNLTCVNLFVMPYNYPILLPMIEEMLKKPQHPGKPPKDWKPAFDEYLRTMPAYYANPLKRALTRMNVVGSLVPDNLEGSCFSYAVHSKLKSHKNEAKAQFDRLIQSMQHQPKNQNYDAVRVLQCGNSLRSQVESTSYCNMGCTGRPTPAFYYRYSAMKSELNEFPNYIVRVRDKASTFTSNENLRIKHTFRNPYDIDRKDLIDQIHLMRANFMQPPARIKFKDEDQIHTLPVAQMGNYQDYLKKQPAPLREIESTPVRQHMFGNPFKIDKKGMMVDEADNLGPTDVGSPSQKNKKINPNQRRRGPLPKDFILLSQNSWRRSPSTSPVSSPSPLPNDSENSNDPSDTDHLEQNGNSSTESTNPTNSTNTSNNTLRPTEQDLALRSDIFKRIRGPGINYATVLKMISKLQGEKRKFILEETIREAKRFKKVTLLHQLNLISRINQ